MAKSTEQLCRELDALYKENSRDKLEAFFMEEILDHVPGCCDVSSEYIFLMNEAGTYYRSISCYEQAASYFQGLLSTMERFGLNGSAAYATVLNNLAGVYRMTGQLEQAQELFRQALTCYEAAGAENSAEYTSALNNLSLCYQAGHDLEKALYYQKKALSCSRQLSAAPEALAASYVNIGALYCAAGDMDRAMEHVSAAVELLEHTGRTDTTAYTGALHTRAFLLHRQGHPAQAAEQYLQAAARTETMFGRNSDYATAKRNAALACRDAGEPDRAIRLMQESLQADEAILPAGHTRLVSGQKLLRQLLQETGA